VSVFWQFEDGLSILRLINMFSFYALSSVSKALGAK